MFKKLLKPVFMAILVMSMGAISFSCGEGKNLEIPGVIGPNVNVVNDQIRIDMILENTSIAGGGRISIPKFQGSFVEFGPALESPGTLLVISISLKAAVGGDGLARSLDPQTLPGGRAIPGIIGGRLPAVAFTVDNFLKGASFYVGNKFLGVFIPYQMNVGVNNIITARFNVGDKKAGNISIVGPDASNKNSGLLLMLDLDANTKKVIQKLIEKAERNKQSKELRAFHLH